MATTSLTLGSHWERFVKEEVASGRYGSVSEVIRDGLRTLEMRQTKLATLRAHLLEGEAQAARGEYVDSFSMDELIRDQDDAKQHSISGNTPGQG